MPNLALGHRASRSRSETPTCRHLLSITDVCGCLGNLGLVTRRLDDCVSHSRVSLAARPVEDRPRELGVPALVDGDRPLSVGRDVPRRSCCARRLCCRDAPSYRRRLPRSTRSRPRQSARVSTSPRIARVDAAAGHLSEQRLRSFLPQLVALTDDDGERRIGPAIEIGLPIFDWNSGGRARARGEQRKALHELTAVAVELRAARITALATFAEARHLRDVVLPLRQQVVEQSVLHYNAMDADPFALIDARQDLAGAGARYLDALRRYARAMATVRALERGVALDQSSTEALH